MKAFPFGKTALVLLGVAFLAQLRIWSLLLFSSRDLNFAGVNDVNEIIRQINEATSKIALESTVLAYLRNALLLGAVVCAYLKYRQFLKPRPYHTLSPTAQRRQSRVRRR